MRRRAAWQYSLLFNLSCAILLIMKTRDSSYFTGAFPGCDAAAKVIAFPLALLSLLLLCLQAQ